MASEIQIRLQGLSDDFTKLQQGMRLLVSLLVHFMLTLARVDLQTAVGARQKLEAQKQENLGVQKVRRGQPLGLTWTAII